MQELLLVGVGMMGRPYVTAARRLGLRVRAVETEARAGLVRPEVDALHLARGDLDEQWAEAAFAAITDGAPGGVIAFTEWQVLAAALVQDRLGVPGPSLHASMVSRNKALQRGLFAAAGVPQPEHTVVPALAEATAWALPRLPVVVKPLSSAGSMGVELVATAAEFAAAAGRRSGPLIVETAVEGPEYSWEGFVRDGQVWLGHVTAKQTTGPPYFVEVQHRGGVHFPGTLADQVGGLVGRVLDALGMRTGIVHLEFRLTPAGPVLMEVAVRTPGGYIMDLVGLTYGIDPYEIAVRLAMGLPLPPAPEAPVSCAATILPTTPCGRVVAIDGLAEVRAHPHVTDAGTWAEVGGTVASQPSGFGRVSYAVLSAPDPSALDEAIAFAGSRLRVRTEPVP